MTMIYDVVIIGAGASGLFCAMTAAKLGKHVLVIDHANKAGKKILMSGGGRCNFTNLDVSSEHFLSQNIHFCKSALKAYQNWDFIDMVNRHGIAYHEREYGQLFCVHSASDIVKMLLDECKAYQVAIHLKTTVKQINQTPKGFVVHASSEHEVVYQATSLVVATGGLSIPTMGATGFGYQIAEQFGHKIVPVQAALVPFVLTDKLGDKLKALAGISLPVIAFNDKVSFHLPLLFTHRGLSGPAMLQLSNYWRLGEPIWINLLPDLNVGDFLLDIKRSNPKRLLKTVLTDDLPCEPLPKKLLSLLQELFWANNARTQIANIKDELLITIGQNLNAWQIMPSGTEGYRTAEVTLGGVSCEHISSKTMQSKLVPNLYFIGEVLDVTGRLGGYNFQWAWSSGYACALAIAGNDHAVE